MFNPLLSLVLFSVMIIFVIILQKRIVQCIFFGNEDITVT